MTRVYIGSGLDNEQFLIASNFIQLDAGKGICELFTDQKLEPWFRDKLCQRFGVSIVEFNYPIFNSVWSGCVSIIFVPLVLILLSRPRNLLLFHPWPWINIALHSIYDTAYRFTSTASIRPTIWQLSLATIRCGIAIARASFLLKKGFNYFVSGHNVYQFKIFNFVLSRHAHVYIQGRSNLRRIDRNNLFDSPLSLPPGFDIESIDASDELVTDFWESRRKGGTKNQEFLLANSGKTINPSRPINIVFCHVFHDSPFFLYPGRRLFVDFIDWIGYTLKICASSNEEWIFRLHPSAASWGENSRTLMEKLIDKHAPGAKNIKIIENEYSVESLIKASKRIVTYSGTIQIEAVIMGKRPVIVGGGLVEQYAKDCAYTPSTLAEYVEFLKGDRNYRLLSNSRINLLRLMYGSETCRTYEVLLGLSKKVGGRIGPAEIDRLFSIMDKNSEILVENSKRLFNKGYLWFVEKI